MQKNPKHLMINFSHFLDSCLQLMALQVSQFEYELLGFYPTLSLGNSCVTQWIMSGEVHVTR